MKSEEEEVAAYKRLQGKYGRKGGESTLKRHGSRHFSKISKVRWAKVKKEKKI